MASPKGEKEQARAQTLGAEVRRLRRERGGETLAELAERVPMSASNLSRLELGKQGPPSDEVIESIAAALEVDAQVLLHAAGRIAGGPSFEEEVLKRLDALGDDMREVKAAMQKTGTRS